jgi:hypothetical protein
MFDNVGCILVRGMPSMLLQRLCIRLPSSIWPRLIQNRFHICDGGLFVVPHRPIGLVDILIVIKESVFNIKSEAAGRLIRG